MFGWIGDLFKGVVNWVSGGKGADKSSFLKKTITGALIGAAGAAIAGKDIKKGALGGIVLGLGVSLLGRKSEPTTPQDSISGPQNLSLEGEKSIAGVPTKAIPESSVPTAEIPEEKQSYFKTDEGKRTLLSAGQGLLTGASEYMKSKEDYKRQKELSEMSIAERRRYQKRQIQAEKDKITANQPGAYTAQTAKINRANIGSWWDKHLEGDN